MTRILAFDTAAETCSVILWEDMRVISSKIEPMKWGHAAFLVPMIEEVFSSTELTYKDLDALAVTIGAGGFTGVRVGIATAKGIALSINKPVWGISSFEALFAQISSKKKNDKDVAVVLDSRRKELFFQLFNSKGEEIIAPSFAKEEDIIEKILPFCQKESLLISSNFELEIMKNDSKKYNKDITFKKILPNAFSLPDIVMRNIKQGKRPEKLSPLYIRKPDVSFSKKKALRPFRPKQEAQLQPDQ